VKTPPAPPRAGPPPSEARELLGLPEEAVVRRLGEPVLRRPEGPAEVWLYTARSCALDVILYRDEPPRPGPLRAAGGPGRGMEGAGGVLRVAFAAARATGAEPRSEAACLREIAGGNGSAASGKASPPPADADSVEAVRGTGGLTPPGLAWSGDAAPRRAAAGRNAMIALARGGG
ncbi:MAG: hypothetical protein IRZ13_13310, partial [Acetobacteraceae bacterium]|nr:hypothetical protein [Acetobacteraceae bacterium]